MATCLNHFSTGHTIEQDIHCMLLLVLFCHNRGAMNRSVFVRVEVILKGATFHVIFSDAANFPPPFRLENLSQVALC